jgi:hypothetical protein
MSPKLFAKTTRENHFWGVSNLLEEDFFASSPSANLVGVIEEGHGENILRGVRRELHTSFCI